MAQWREGERSQFSARKSRIQASASRQSSRQAAPVVTLTFNFAHRKGLVLIPFMSHLIFRRSSLLLSVAVALFFVGCDGDDPRAAQSQYLGGVYGNTPVSTSAPRDSVSYWDGDGMPGKPSIKIKLGEQRAYFYKGGQLVGISQLSTGREGMGTSKIGRASCR